MGPALNGSLRGVVGLRSWNIVTTALHGRSVRTQIKQCRRVVDLLIWSVSKVLAFRIGKEQWKEKGQSSAIGILPA